MKKTPLATVKDRFESKEKLVAAVQALATPELWLDRVSDLKGIARVSNAKLVRMHDKLAFAKSQFGTRSSLIDSIAELAQRTKDAGYKAGLAAYPLPRLLDVHAAMAKKAKQAKAALVAAAAK